MNSYLQKKLEIKERKQEQLLIIKNVKWNKIAWIIKKTENMKMQIAKHQKKIMFNKMKMSEHKIMLKMNWL